MHRKSYSDELKHQAVKMYEQTGDTARVAKELEIHRAEYVTKWRRQGYGQLDAPLTEGEHAEDLKDFNALHIELKRLKTENHRIRTDNDRLRRIVQGLAQLV